MKMVKPPGDRNHLELALVRVEPGFVRLQQQVRQIAGLLEEYPSIPAIAKELALIAEVQTDEWWTDVTLPMLETVRRRLRLLVQFIERHKRKIIYTDFEDEIGVEVDVEFRELATAEDSERFRRKARAFLREHTGEAAVEFLDETRFNANQIEFVNLAIDYLTENGTIEPRRFYESPFTDLSPQGPDALFESSDVDRLLEVVGEVRRRAEAA
ncbi:MAG: type I restriction-modification enzyme R subunit C-terminal domain-containing protein [Actinomycetota bacterium]|nr:type I restriction-modification enzyme R subunit C-terminal domain-containing protein [Actinomycetota bacterium]